MSEEERVFEYLRAYVKRGGTTPTIRKLCREFDTTPPTLYKKYGPLEDLCRKANVEIDDQTRVRLRMSMKATRKHVHRAEKKRTGNNAHALKQPPVAPVQDRAEGPVKAGPEPRQSEAFQELMQIDTDHSRHPETDGLTDDEEAVAYAEEFAEELITLVVDAKSVTVNSAVMDALHEVFPIIMLYKYDVDVSIEDLVGAKNVLRRSRSTLKTIHRKELDLEEREQKLKAQMDLLKDAQEGKLMDRIERLQWKLKNLEADKANALKAIKHYHAVFLALSNIVRKCQHCSARFTEFMQQHPEQDKWFLSGEWGLSKLDALLHSDMAKTYYMPETGSVRSNIASRMTSLY